MTDNPSGNRAIAVSANDVAHGAPPSDGCVVRNLIDRGDTQHPDRVFAVFSSGEPHWTYAELRRQTIETAAGLIACGVRQGDHVAFWLPNGPAALRYFCAINYLGAVYVPFNLAYKGKILDHVIGLSDAKLIVVHADLFERLREADRGRLTTAIIVGAEPAAPIPGIAHVIDGATGRHASDIALDRPIMPYDPQMIIFTSGTTGPSKGVLASYLHMYTMATSTLAGAEIDRALAHLPMFHIAGLVVIIRMLSAGGSIAVFERFRTETFWRDVRRTGATHATLMGSMVSFLEALPRTEDEIATPLRHVIFQLTAETIAFARRIGVSYHTHFNMSEVSCPIISGLNPTKPGICGRPRPGIEARIVDEHDFEVAPGTVGELILRADTPWTMNSGYYQDAEATARAWRNGWFHTGDAFRQDADDDFVFVDRIKDAIRRRGENISSYEVEAEVIGHPDVEDCAAVAVPAGDGEDEVLCLVQPRQGVAIDPRQLVEFLIPRLPHYMVPRYIRIIEQLPRTPTQKVQKHLLRDEGITTDTWDRVAAGILIGRDGVVRSPTVKG